MLRSTRAAADATPIQITYAHKRTRSYALIILVLYARCCMMLLNCMYSVHTSVDETVISAQHRTSVRSSPINERSVMESMTRKVWMKARKTGFEMLVLGSEGCSPGRAPAAALRCLNARFMEVTTENFNLLFHGPVSRGPM